MDQPLLLLPIDIVVPNGATFQRLPGSCLLAFSGVMMQFLMPKKLSPPVLGILVESGRNELLQRLIEDGNSRQKASQLVRGAEKMLETTTVEITDVQLGSCFGRRYTYLSEVNTQRIYQYALQIRTHFVNVTATQMVGDSALPEIERTISTLSVQQDR